MFDASLSISPAKAGSGASDLRRLERGTMAPERRTSGCANVTSYLLTAILFWLASIFAFSTAYAQDGGLIARGDAVVTGFSGIKTDAEVPKTVHPLDRTFIDLDGTSVRVLDLSRLGTAPSGQLSDVPAKLEIKARDTGQVFGVTLDDASPPNAYVSATSMYGLQIIGKTPDGAEERLVEGAEGATWMPGQFGAGGPGAIYKIDGKTGVVSLFSKIDSNTGPALGNITFDAGAQQFFVSDLESGLIHRIGRDGSHRGTFDHGKTGRVAQGLDAIEVDRARRLDITKSAFSSEDTETWGYADERRRVFGLAVHMGRLFYAIAEGPSIWSVAINEDGSVGDDARIELEVRSALSMLDITDIAFDGRGHLLLSQRGERIGSYDYTTFAKPQQAAVLRYTWDDKDGRWSEAADEYALGLKSDHRATQGGLALNYGYDASGAIDYGTCRQTLWTTGEHLRQGEDAKRIASGGPALVTGLQGNYLGRVRPDNAPPNDAWYTDLDGRFDDPSQFGHAGDVAIYAPCDGAIERAEAPPPPLYVPPVPAPAVIVDKRCDAGAIGGKIRCTISVTNISGGLASSEATLIDVTKIMYGPGAGTIIPIASFASPLPGVICTLAPDFSCTIPAALLLPGVPIAIDVFVDTHDLALAGNLGFRNCATVLAGGGISKACAQGGTDIVVEKIGPGECVPGGTCKFGLRFANAGLMPFNGDLILADAMFVGGASTNAPITAVNPAVACTAGNMNQLPFTCLTHVSLLPGEERLHWVEVTMPAPGDYWAENCFGALDPALLPLPPGPPVMGGGGAGNPSCVWVHVPAPKPNLKLTKTALNNGLCSKVGDQLDCDFTIELRNQDSVAFNGPISVQEAMPAGGIISHVSAPWGCAGVPPAYVCSTGAAVNIPPGGTTAFNVRVSQSVADSEANLCKVPNKAKISVPAGGAAPNVDASDDEAEAQALTLGLYWEDPITGITFVMCDPTNLKVEKTSEDPCTAEGNGFACRYDVAIINMGPDPYKGPIKLKETFGLEPTNVSFSGDLACAGGGSDYTCEKADVHLAAGARLNLKVKALVPDTGTCEAPNTATLVSPPENARGNTDGSDDSSSATAQVPSRKCRSGTPPVVNTCPDGLPIPKNGRCPCPEGTTWNRADKVCDASDDDDPRGCKPGVHEVKLDNGRCVCREGYMRNKRGICVPDDDDNCGPDAYLDQRTGDCRPYEDEELPPECAPNEYRTSVGRCVCRPGLLRIAGLCSPLIVNPLPPIVRDCPKGFTGVYPYCRRIPQRCPYGYKGKYPDCRIVLPDPPTTCGRNAYPIGKRCECRPGFRRLGLRDCVPEITRPCPKGQIGQWPNCKPVIRPCPEGFTGAPPNCRRIGPPQVLPCPPGTTGKRPNCKPIVKPPTIQKCPAGTRGKWPNCKPLGVNPIKPNIKPPTIRLPGSNPNKQRVPGQNGKPGGSGFGGGGGNFGVNPKLFGQ